MAPATFYTVKGPHGIYYAVRNHQTGQVWTERTELAAERQAADEQLAIVASETIEHHQMLDLMIAHGLNTHASLAANRRAAEPTEKRGLFRILKRFGRNKKHAAPGSDSSR